MTNPDKRYTVVILANVAILRTWTIQRNVNLAQQAECDIVIADDRGRVYSGKSSNYFETPEEAIEDRKRRATARRETCEKIIDGIDRELNALEKMQLD